MSNNKQWVCYLIKSDVSNRTYIGATNNFKRRIRQHNGEIKGGAKYTSANRPWKPKLIVSGFISQNEALSFEWRIKRSKINNKFKIVSYLDKRIKNIFNVFKLDKFTSKCNDTSLGNYKINILPEFKSMELPILSNNILVEYNEFTN